jgi:hypothetical protein
MDNGNDTQEKKTYFIQLVDCVRNVMAHAQKPVFVFRRNGRVHLNRRGRQFGRLPAAEVCASAVVMLDTPCFEVVWRVLATNSIRKFCPSLPPPCVTVCHYISTGLYTVKKIETHKVQYSFKLLITAGNSFFCIHTIKWKLLLQSACPISSFPRVEIEHASVKLRWGFSGFWLLFQKERQM